MIILRSANEPASLTEQEFTLFQRLILREAGIFLSEAKRALLVGRLIRRVRELELPTFGAYYSRIAGGDAQELVRLLDAIATNETHFFREPKQFELLEDRVCGEWLVQAAAAQRARRVRVWSAACSTGEEPYSIAMVLLDRLGEDWDLEIVASDLSTKVLDRAAQAVFPIGRADEIPEHYRRRFMLRGIGPEEGNCRAGKAVRAPVRFERINLNDDEYPVTGMFDAIFCRNVLIYFDSPSRMRVIERLTRRLVPGGYLFLGHAESAARTATDLRPVMPAVYQRRAVAAAAV
ncbi:MAG TPA: protein-glutamate O-methyltransferase CheR [Gemmatimonadales bacterium]|nr:protein-glutamate O-methyltransferase CheR [Gemmatimonadales bacterium]